MVRPLKKQRADGTSYQRRPPVESEIKELEQLTPTALMARCSVLSKSALGYVSPEALLYFARSTDKASDHYESILRILLERVTRLLPQPDSPDGATVDSGKLEVRDRVLDGFVDRLVTDQNEYTETLDYFEVSFNDAMAKDRMDAHRQVRIERDRAVTLENEDDEILPEVEEAVEQYDPFDAEELDKKNYRLRLDAAIDALPPLQRRIVEMMRLDIPISSSDPSICTISSALGKAEKTIRNQRDRAFATLRRRLERKESLL